MDEVTFFENDGVRVTNARFIVDANTYAVRNITSTAAWTKKQQWVAALLLALFGVGSLAGAPPIGIFFLLTAALAWYLGRPMHYVRLHTSGGEVKAVKSRDLEFVKKIVHALNEAMIAQHKAS